MMENFQVAQMLFALREKLLQTTWWLHSYDWKLNVTSWHAKTIYLMLIANIGKGEVFDNWWNMDLKLNTKFCTT